jgi:hypothetical protein
MGWAYNSHNTRHTFRLRHSSTRVRGGLGTRSCGGCLPQPPSSASNPLATARPSRWVFAHDGRPHRVLRTFRGNGQAQGLYRGMMTAAVLGIQGVRLSLPPL